MPTLPNANNAGLLAHDLEITLRVPYRQRRSRAGAKHSRVFVVGEVPVQDLAKLNAHWYEPLFVALSVNAKDEVVKVHIFARQAQQLAYPHSGIQRHKGDGVRAKLVTPDGLPAYQAVNLRHAKRR